MGGRGREASEAPPQTRPANRLQVGLQRPGSSGEVWFFHGPLERRRKTHLIKTEVFLIVTFVNYYFLFIHKQKYVDSFADLRIWRKLRRGLSAHRRLAETLVEADQPAENLLAVGVQLLQLLLDERRVQRRALLDQALSEDDEPVDAFGVQGDLLLEALRRQQLTWDGPYRHVKGAEPRCKLTLSRWIL